MTASLSTRPDGDLTLDEASGVVGHAIAEARRLGVAVSVAVCGGQGRLVAFSKMDGAGCMTARGAIGKAVASALSGEPSEVLRRPGEAVWTSFVEAEGTAAFHERGGVPLRRDGALIGAVGVFGDASSEQDLACATAGSYALRSADTAADGVLASSTERPVVTDDAPWIGGREAEHRDTSRRLPSSDVVPRGTTASPGPGRSPRPVQGLSGPE
ncbi:GlcG/HbpS family heme-binding protein [Methylobacterium sp. J-077]|uniref:GlcG/HbpS family heme-binding protein n=1 Tax=Methylobacterium sp. J-077 TaxID=2836656 RepID=UPI001FBAE4BA|nr:heme-binding protein [Methylobacterium sp. J-077]MCJ2125620.1 heme-binding protein [Methylobacterium sp. J-077]